MKNKFKIKRKVTEIYVQSSKYGLKIVLIDTEDLNLVSKYSWCIAKINNNLYCRSTKKPQIKLHRLITSFSKKKFIYHNNYNTLDNRKQNLRICTNKDNSRNNIKQINNTSEIKGVCPNIQKKNGKIYKYWRSHIKYNKKNITLGYFPYTEKGRIQAAKRYDQEAKKLFKEYALLNFPEEKESL